MVEASKIMFDKTVAYANCCDVIHPWSKGCIYANFSMFISCFKGSHKFYAILYIVQIFMKGKKLSKSYLLKQLKSYLKSSAVGYVMGTCLICISCIFRKMFNRFHYYTMAALPPFISATAIYLEPPNRRYLIINTYFNMVLEYWVRTLEYKRILNRSVFREMFVFMCGSAYLLYLMRQEKDYNRKIRFLWFFEPPGVKQHSYENESNCPHTGNCKNYILKGTFQMFQIGLAMTMFRKISSEIKNPMNALKSITNKDFKFGIFLGGYIGIYRTIVCLLCKHYNKDSATHAIPAGFLAGTVFWFNPSLSISLASITCILHILCSRLYESNKIPENIPFPELLFCFSQGLLTHARVMHPDCCPRYIFKMINFISDGKMNAVYERFLKILMS